MVRNGGGGRRSYDVFLSSVLAYEEVFGDG